MNTYRYITAVHGNEPIPVLALADMGMTQMIANPRALARGVRYTEQDLNSSFGTSGSLYEEHRAREIAASIKPGEYVIDFHTFSCVSEPFAIIVDLAQLQLAVLTGVSRVVYMKHNIKAGHALINHCPGVSIEVGSHTDPESFTYTQEVVRNLERGRTHNIRLYEVYDRILVRGDYTNFQEKDGFIPVLYGERAYDSRNFYGLKARDITGTIRNTEEI